MLAHHCIVAPELPLIGVKVEQVQKRVAVTHVSPRVQIPGERSDIVTSDNATHRFAFAIVQFQLAQNSPKTGVKLGIVEQWKIRGPRIEQIIAIIRLFQRNSSTRI